MDDVSKVLGEHEARLKHIEEGQDEIRTDLKILLGWAAEVRGGKKFAYAMFSALGAIFGGVLAWLSAQ